MARRKSWGDIVAQSNRINNELNRRIDNNTLSSTEALNRWRKANGAARRYRTNITNYLTRKQGGTQNGGDVKVSRRVYMGLSAG